MNEAELENARRRLAAERIDTNWVGAMHRLSAGDTTAYRRFKTDTFHADHACPHPRGGSSSVKLYPMWYARESWSLSACDYCVLPEGSS